MSANIPRSGDVATDETGTLISDECLQSARRKLGSVYDVMLNKLNGQVAYAIMSFGGFLGMGESYHPLPWRALTYDPGAGGYVVDIDRNRLESAPYYKPGDEPNWSRALIDTTAARPKVRWKQTPPLHRAGFVFKGRILLSQKGDL
jgi:hypothetical protein